MTEKEQQFVSSTEELDHILAEQLHSTRKQLKVAKRHLKLMPNDPWLIKGIPQIESKMQFYERMIQDKELIKKKKKKKKDRNPDVLTRSLIYTLYRDAFFVSTYGYRVILNTAQGYLSLLTKKKDNK